LLSHQVERRAGAIMQTGRIIANCMAIAGLAIVSLASAAEPQLVVHVASGRQFRGTLDRASNMDQLMLRSELAGITLRRPIRWERVTSATADGVPLEVGALRQMAIAQESDNRSQRPLLTKI